MVTITSHAGTAIGLRNGRGRRLAQPEIICDCGRRFPATRHPREDQLESPEWEAHVKRERLES